MFEVKDERQTLFGIALQQFGAIEGVFYLLKDNQIQAGSSLQKGQKIKVRQAVLNAVVVTEFQNQTIVS